MACETCDLHSGIGAKVESLEKSDVQQWSELHLVNAKIERIMNRPPVWTTVVISVLTFALGFTLNYLRTMEMMHDVRNSMTVTREVSE